MILLRFFIRTPFEINIKVIDPFFIKPQCNLQVKEMPEKNTLLVYTLLIYNMLLGYGWCGCMLGS